MLEGALSICVVGSLVVRAAVDDSFQADEFVVALTFVFAAVEDEED